jgi:hypothetical protein
MFGTPTVTNHVNKSYKLATGGVVPAAGTIGEFPSGIMPQGAPVQQPEPVVPQKPEEQPTYGTYAPNSPGRMGSNR